MRKSPFFTLAILCVLIALTVVVLQPRAADDGGQDGKKKTQAVGKQPAPNAEVVPRQSAASTEDRSARRTRGRKVSDRFPNILLYTQDNKPVRFYDDLVKDRIVIVNFMYTSCVGT